MKLNPKNKKNKKPLIIALVVIAVLALGYVAYARATNIWPFPNDSQSSTKVDDVNYEPPTEDQVDAGDDIKDAANDAVNTPAPTGTVEMSITAANQNDGILQVRTLIQTTSNTGTCTLLLKKGSTEITKSAPVQALSSSTTCQGFDVPTSELSTGTWQLTINFKNTTVNSTISQSVVIK